jgi:hypothetical protein
MIVATPSSDCSKFSCTSVPYSLLLLAVAINQLLGRLTCRINSKAKLCHGNELLERLLVENAWSGRAGARNQIRKERF